MADLQDGQVEILYRHQRGYERKGKMMESGKNGMEDILESVAGALFGVKDPNGLIVAVLPNGVEITFPTNGKLEDEDGAEDERLGDWSFLVLHYLESWMSF